MKSVFISVISLLVGAAAGYAVAMAVGVARGPGGQTAARVIMTDTVVKTDTVVVRVPAPKPAMATDRVVAVTRDVARVDSDSVFIPTEKVVYEDSAFRAVLTGVRPRLDSLTLYPRTLTVTRSVATVRTRRWGLGVTAGASITPRGIAPGVTVGVTYNIVTF